MRSFLTSVVFLHLLALLTVAGERQPLRALSVGEQSLSRFLLGSGMASVDGTLLIGGEPAPAGTALSFHKDGRHWFTKTGAGGRFKIDLAEAGRYTINLDSAEHLATAIINLAFQPGMNPVQLELPGGAIRVQPRRVDGAPLTEPVQLHVSGQASLAGFIQPSDGLNRTLIGLDFGSYRIRGDTKSDLVSEFAEVTLSPAAPVATVTLLLSEQRGTLRLVDSRGSPIPRAEVQARAVMLESPPGSGSYAIRRVPKGEELLITAEGFLPTCVVTALPTMSVTLAPQGPHTATIRIEPAPRTLFGEVIGLPGAECAVPIRMLSVTQRKDGDALAVDIKGLPAGTLRYRPLAKAAFSVLSVPGPPLTVVSPAKRSP